MIGTGWMMLLLALSGPVPAKAVLRGEKVTLAARAGAVVAEGTAQALEDGAPGDTIRVRNLQNGKVQAARVVAPGRVEVEVPQ